MQDPAPQNPHTSSLLRLMEWWTGSRADWARLERIDQLNSDQIRRMADDVAMTPAEFRSAVNRPGGLTSLLERRLEGLGIDAEEIQQLSPMLLGDLRRTCATCPDKERCAADMEDSSNPTGWDSYCPNAGTLKTLT